ncbi:SMP-30/gluconolactonase/LRE family protein [Roseinatronobacter sp.]
MQVEIAHDAQAETGESPVWCIRRQLLFWVDIGAGVLYAHDPAQGQNQSWQFDQPLGCIALTAGDDLLLALRDGLFRFNPHNDALALIATPEAHLPQNRPNDGAMSRDGRFFFGTMRMQPDGQPHGTLYRLDPDGSVSALLEGLHVPNGLAVSADNRVLYLSDSWRDVRKIWAFDLDDRGGISNQRLFLDTAGRSGRPDGACMDAEGYYWSAAIEGGQLLRLTPEGDVDRVIDLPVEKPTKPCFGGADLGTLFVTSLGMGDPSDHAGALLALRPGVTGLPEPLLAI